MPSDASPALLTVHRGARATVGYDARGALVRIYHDTGRRDQLATVPRGARPATARAHYRGVMPLHVPPRLQRLVAALHESHVPTIASAARAMGVETSTAWSYACTLAAIDPGTHPLLARLVWPPLYAAVATVDARGTLREVARRLTDGPFATTPEWRALNDRLAHLRLCRLLQPPATAAVARAGTT